MPSKRPHTSAFFTAIWLTVVLVWPPGVRGGLVQAPRLAEQLPSSAPQMRDLTRQIFADSYQAYREYAFGHDTVSPVSKSFSDGRNGWGASIIDGLSTMSIMGLDDFFAEAVRFASGVDFTKSNTDDTVSVFETTIRHVGGLLSAYELSGRQYPALLAQAKQLGDKLAFAWDLGNDIPYSHVDFSSNTPQRGVTSNIAEAGTLTLEWAMLTKYTNNDTYRDLADKSALHIANSGAPLPGLPAQGIDPDSGSPVGSYVTWGGRSDSYFEYLIKYPRFDFQANPVYADSWRTAVDSSIRTLYKYSDVGGWAYLADYDPSGPQGVRHIGSHLACFHGGNWLLGGRMLNNQTVVDLGLKLIDSCWNTYTSTGTGIGPERFAFITSGDGYTGGPAPTPTQLAFNSQHGFYITAPQYQLRPEVLESNFYAWRVTGDTKYFDRAVTALQSFMAYLAVNGSSSLGYTGLVDVTDTTVKGASNGRIDTTESFWFSEVLKYIYLTFDDPSHISLDEYVFNTEAHPFRAPIADHTVVYGSGKPYRISKPFTTTKGALPAVSGVSTGSTGTLLSSIGGLVSF